MVCSDIKETACAKVAGSCPEKGCYRFLVVIACLAFLFAFLNVCIGAQETITEVEIDALDVMVFPVAYFCMVNSAEENMDMQQLGGPNGCDGKKYASVLELDLKGTEGPKYTCIEFGKSSKNGGTSKLAEELENRFRVYSISSSSPNGETWNCYTMNENDKVSSVPNVYKDIRFEWKTTVTTATQYSTDLTVRTGILDPKLKTFAEQTENGLTVFEVDMVNSNTQVSFTVDEMITQDISSIILSTKAGANVKKLADMTQTAAVDDILKDDSVQLKFNPTMNSNKMHPMVQLNVPLNGLISFVPLNYVTRVVTKRYKTWDEIWSAIGGAWATAVLLVTAFYVQKTVEDPKKKGEKAVPMETVQCFRLRGVSSKQAAIKELFNVARDAYEGGKANFEEGKTAQENMEQA